MSSDSGGEEKVRVAHRLFDAIMAGDSAAVAALVTPDCLIWHNYDERDKPFSEMIPKLSAFRAMLSAFAYRDRRYAPLPDGALALHVLHGSTADGRTARVPVAVRLTFAAGHIHRIEEYVDPAALAPLTAGNGAPG